MGKLCDISIVIVEDDPAFVELVKKILKRKSFENIQIFTSGQEFLDTGYYPDVLICDLNLKEEKTGFDICRIVRRANPNTYAICVTTDEDGMTQLAAMANKVNKLVRKTGLGMTRRLIDAVIDYGTIATTRKQLEDYLHA